MPHESKSGVCVGGVMTSQPGATHNCGGEAAEADRLPFIAHPVCEISSRVLASSAQAIEQCQPETSRYISVTRTQQHLRTKSCKFSSCEAPPIPQGPPAHGKTVSNGLPSGVVVSISDPERDLLIATLILERQPKSAKTRFCAKPVQQTARRFEVGMVNPRPGTEAQSVRVRRPFV